MSELADEVWAAMTELVAETRSEWRHKVMAEVGMPFSRVRVLHKLAGGPLTMGELAAACMTDAPAATVAVNDLERRGLVERRVHPDSGRVKIVSLTDQGREMLTIAGQVVDVAPAGVEQLPERDLAELKRILGSIILEQ